MAIALYHFDRCPYCEKVRLALDIEGLAFESLVIDPEDRTEVQRISGQRAVPVLVDRDGSVLTGSNSILQHLSGNDGSHLLPEGRRDRALCWILVDRADKVLSALTRSLRRGIDPEGHPLSGEDLRRVRRRLDDELSQCEDLLERADFMVGPHPTVADVAAHAFLGRLSDEERRGLTGSYERVDAWFNRVLEAAGRAA